MFDSSLVPSNLSAPGFYYHNKYDPSGPFNNHAYEILGAGYHTETGEYAVSYRPLYEEAFSYQNGLYCYNRPVEMFMEAVMRDGRETPRFIPITDQELIEKLVRKRDEMYPRN